MKLILLFLPLIYTQEKCTVEHLNILKPHYDANQKWTSIFTPHFKLTTDDCELNAEFGLFNRLYITLTLREKKDEECLLKFVLTKQKPFVRGGHRLFEYVPFYIKDYDMKFTTKEEAKKYCISLVSNETEEEKYERLLWHYDSFKEEMQHKMIENLKSEGHLIYAAHLMDQEYTNQLMNPNTDKEKLHSTKLLVKELEAQIAFHFHHTYESHTKLVKKLADEKRNQIIENVRTVFENNKVAIMEGLKRLNQQYLKRVEKKIIEAFAHSTSGFINRRFPMLKVIFPNYEKEMEALLERLLESPYVLSKAFYGLEYVTEKSAVFAYKGLSFLATRMKSELQDMTAHDENCSPEEKYLLGKDHIHSEINQSKNRFNASCKVINHHINDYPFRKYTVILDFTFVKCAYIIERSNEDVFITGEPDKKDKIMQCNPMIVSEYSNALTLIKL